MSYKIFHIQFNVLHTSCSKFIPWMFCRLNPTSHHSQQRPGHPGGRRRESQVLCSTGGWSLNRWLFQTEQGAGLNDLYTWYKSQVLKPAVAFYGPFPENARDLYTNIYNLHRKSEDASDQEEPNDSTADDGTKAKVPENARELSSEIDEPRPSHSVPCSVISANQALSSSAGSPHYSEDFEEDGDNAKEHPEEVCAWKVTKVLQNVKLLHWATGPYFPTCFRLLCLLPTVHLRQSWSYTFHIHCSV